MKLKFFICCLMTTALLATGSIVYGAAQSNRINVNGLMQTLYTELETTRTGHILIALDDFARVLSLELVKNEADQSATITNGTVVVEVKHNNTAFTVDGRTRFFPVTVTWENGTLIVPLRQISQVFNASVTTNNAGVLALNVRGATGQAAENMVLANATGTIGANTTVLTYEEALRLAVAQNNTIRNLQDSMEIMAQRRDDAIDTRRDLLMAGLDSRVLDIQMALATIQEHRLNVPLQQQMIRQSTESMLRNYLSTINSLILDMQLLQERILIDQRAVANLDLKHTLGMVSYNELRIARQELAQRRSNLANLEMTIRRERDALNQLMGFHVNRDIVVTYEPQLTPFTRSIDTHITAAISQDPSIQVHRNATERARANLQNLRRPLDDPGSYDLLRLEAEAAYTEAGRALFDTQRNLEQALRATYTQMQQIQEGQRNLAIELQIAKDNHNAAVASYEAGNITAHDISLARLAILRTEVQMAQNVYSHDLLLFGFTHPFLLAR